MSIRESHRVTVHRRKGVVLFTVRQAAGTLIELVIESQRGIMHTKRRPTGGSPTMIRPSFNRGRLNIQYLFLLSLVLHNLFCDFGDAHKLFLIDYADSGIGRWDEHGLPEF